MLCLLYIVLGMVIAYLLLIRIRIHKFIKKYTESIILYEIFCEILKEDFEFTSIIVETKEYKFEFSEPDEIIKEFGIIVDDALKYYEILEKNEISNEILDEDARELIRLKYKIKMQGRKER